MGQGPNGRKGTDGKGRREPKEQGSKKSKEREGARDRPQGRGRSYFIKAYGRSDLRSSLSLRINIIIIIPPPPPPGGSKKGTGGREAHIRTGFGWFRRPTLGQGPNGGKGSEAHIRTGSGWIYLTATRGDLSYPSPRGRARSYLN